MSKRKSEKRIVLILFGKRLRALRRGNGMTPSQFFVATGIDKETLRRYEDGELEPRLVEIVAMAKALKVSHLELLPDNLDHL